MWKVAVIAGGAAGFLLGSWSGRKPYEQVEGRVLQMAGRAPAQRVVVQMSDAKQRVSEAATETVRVGANRAADVAASTIEAGADRATDAITGIQDSVRP